MPKIITPAMRAHLDEETTRLAAIWRITRKDGARFHGEIRLRRGTLGDPSARALGPDRAACDAR